MKKRILALAILSITFLTSGCVLQDKIAELKMNKMEKIVSTANSKEDFHEDTNSCPNNCTEGCENEHYTSWENYYKEKGINSILYKFTENDYNTIVSFKDESTGADTYAIRVITDLEIGNGGNVYFTYELGRILVNKNNPKKSKCTYNYMAGYDNNSVEWIECSDKSFLASLPEIAKRKKEEYENFKKSNKLAVQAEICGYYDMRQTPECKNFTSDAVFQQIFEQEKKALSKLRSTTL